LIDIHGTMCQTIGASHRQPPAALPRALRNRLAALILKALDDRQARQRLEAIGECRAQGADDWLAGTDAASAAAFTDRVCRALSVVRAGPLNSETPGLQGALADAARLFDAGLYFEVHERLEPHWVSAVGPERETLQGLIQIAVGYQHLANGNLQGARSLLADGSARIASRQVGEIDLTPFAEAVQAGIERIGAADFDWALVPGFPRRRAGHPRSC
jgi:hypothetical protein